MIRVNFVSTEESKRKSESYVLEQKFININKLFITLRIYMYKLSISTHFLLLKIYYYLLYYERNGLENCTFGIVHINISLDVLLMLCFPNFSISIG